MEKKKVAYCIIKSLSDVERVLFKQKIKCGKQTKNAERLEKLYSFFETHPDPIHEVMQRYVKDLKHVHCEN